MNMEAIAEQCPVRQRKDGSQCTGPLGHEGPHGIYMHEGFVIAPWNGGYDPSIPEEPFGVPCDCCGQPMTVARTEDGAYLSCTACQQCHWFGRDGEHSTTVIARLWPSYPSG